MNIDETDIGIFLYFLDSKTSHSVVEIAKHLFNPETRREMVSKVSMINYRLRKWVEQDVLSIEMVHGVKRYSLVADKVHYGDSELLIGDKKIEAGKAIAVQVEGNNYLAVFFLENNDV